MRSHLWNALRPAAALGASLALFALASTSSATVYEVGDGQPYPAIGAVPWESLPPATRCSSTGAPAPYKEKWVICRAGTAAQPIVVRGVPGARGRAAGHRRQRRDHPPAAQLLERGPRRDQDRRRQHPARHHAALHRHREPRDPQRAPAVHLHRPRTALTAYATNAAAIYVEKGEHITIRNCLLQRLRQRPVLPPPQTHATSLVEGNCIVRQRQRRQHLRAQQLHRGDRHHLPVQPLRPAARRRGGNNLKDRSAGLVVRYNWIEGGNRQLDLVDERLRRSSSDDPRYRSTLRLRQRARRAGRRGQQPDRALRRRLRDDGPRTARARSTSTTTRSSRRAPATRRCCACRRTTSTATPATTSST